MRIQFLLFLLASSTISAKNNTIDLPIYTGSCSLSEPNKPQKRFIGPLIEHLNDLNETTVDLLHRILNKHPHSHLDAYVRTGPSLSSEETLYTQKRKLHAKNALERLLGIPIPDNKIPTIAFCFSGGGYRAMLATLGFLQEAEESGLLDTATYISSLSGSTWAIALWCILQGSAETARSHIKTRIHTDLLRGAITLYASKQFLLKKLLFRRKTSLIDFYGGLLTQKLLQGTHNSMAHYLHCHATLFEEKALLPYPIYTSIIARPDNLYNHYNHYAWMEYTPHEIGSTYLNQFIPSWSFGRKFKDGISTTRTPADALGFLLGIWGSAFSANLKEIHQHTQQNLQIGILQTAFSFVTSYDAIGNQRLTAAQVRNFTYGLAGSPIANQRHLTLLDAGLDFNIPLPPVLRPERSVDIIIVLDASASDAVGSELLAAEKFAQVSKLNFPALTGMPKNGKTLTIFRDPTHKAPTIIYMPLIKNERYSQTFDPQESCRLGYCRTTNFVYTPEQVDELTGLTSYMLKENKREILQEIADRIARKSE